VEPLRESPAQEAARLRGCLNDLVSLTALPALWAGAGAPRIAGTLLDALGEMLGPAFVYVRLDDPEGGPAVEWMRTAAPLAGIADARALGDALDGQPGAARASVGGTGVWLASAPLGLHGELGVIVAGSHRPGFPGQTERLLLDVAAGQASMGLRQARLLDERERLARSLDARVAERTRELAAANERLRDEVAERRRAEDALRGNEQKWRLIVDNIPGLVGLLDAAGGVEIVNRQLLEYFGSTMEELREWGTMGIIHPDDLPHVVETFARSIAAGTPYDILQRFRRADGVHRWFSNRGFPLRDPDGSVARWCVLLTDIDERKRAEDALRQSERNLKLTIDTVPALVWSALPDGSADFFNQHYLEFAGFTAGEAAGWGWTAAVHPDDREGLAAAWTRSMASGAAEEAEARMRRHDGEYFWFLFRASPLRDERGEIARWYGVNTNIEDRKRAEADLRRAHDSFADAQQLSHTGSFITDLVGDDHNWSDETYRIFDFDPGSMVTVQRIRDLIHPDDVPPFDAMIARAMTGVDVSFSFRVRTERGGLKHIRGVAHVIERVRGRPMFVGALQDVTETMAAEEALDRARSELAHVSRAATMNALTASIAHEVNQPLAGIITNASTGLRMLDADPPDLEGARETARRTIRDGNRASDVITRLRALFSRKEFTLEPVDLNEGIREVLALSSGDLQRNRVVVQPELSDGLPAVIGDRVQLQQVVLNLLLNAVDAMSGVDDRPRVLLIRTEGETGGGARVTVRDTGTGVGKENLDRCFDAFYTTKQGGMGIGLSVSRSIVERHHGRLWVQPNEGPGSTFIVSIPSRPGSGAGARRG
jgi:PAS domain S-box-containing protein